MDIGRVPPVEGLSSLFPSDMVAELEKHGLAAPGGAFAVARDGASPLINEGRMGIDPRSEQVANAFGHLDNADPLNRPPTPPSPVAESVKKAVDEALKTW